MSLINVKLFEVHVYVFKFRVQGSRGVLKLVGRAQVYCLKLWFLVYRDVLNEIKV